MEKNLVFRNESGGAVTTSALVAEIFEKEQFTVVRDIDNLVEKLQIIENQCPTKLQEHQRMFEAYYEDVLQPNGGLTYSRSFRDGSMSIHEQRRIYPPGNGLHRTESAGIQAEIHCSLQYNGE